MSPGEVCWRIRQAVSDRAAKLMPAGGRPRAVARGKPASAWRIPGLANTDQYLRAADQILDGRANIFEQWRDVGFPECDWNRDPMTDVRSPISHGRLIDWGEAARGGSARITWELNRHFQLVTLAQAWTLSGQSRYRQGAKALLSSWVSSCPYPLGVNWASPLEQGIRLINWYLAARLLQCQPDEAESIEGFMESVYRHCDHIWRKHSRYSSANNHLIGEMAGLYVAASIWDRWKISSKWRRRAKAILEQEAQRQVSRDGVAREQTTGYQIFVLQFLIIAGLVGEQQGDDFSQDYWATIKNMIGFVRAIADAGGNVPNFGDSDDGMVFMLTPDARERRISDLLELDRAFSNRQPSLLSNDSGASWLQSGFSVPRNWPSDQGGETRRVFADGGYFVLGHQFGKHNEVSVVFDAASLGYLSIAAHGHADCLSFVLSLGGVPVLIDPGTYCYDSDLSWRDYFRSTAAHNTVRIDGVDQSEMAGPFMWSRKARPIVEVQEFSDTSQRVRARHDGYCRLSDPVVHTRDIRVDGQASAIFVIDEIAARSAHAIERFWHFADDCVVQVVGEAKIVAESRKAVIEIHFSGADRVNLYRGCKVPQSGWVSHRFGNRSPTTTAAMLSHCRGAASLSTTITWRFL